MVVVSKGVAQYLLGTTTFFWIPKIEIVCYWNEQTHVGKLLNPRFSIDINNVPIGQGVRHVELVKVCWGINPKLLFDLTLEWTFHLLIVRCRPMHKGLHYFV